ncbi:MAG: long-chain fatty acid--CoA ligase [Anaerolineae bacterium]|nr:long-chain fatty acid--CoA ligase [Anaerolineae bacterium]MDW8072101.1 long-chain fatty acid--CoA ligase [Anaerolineae bacterium]
MEILQRPWLRFYDEDVPRTLTYDPVTIPDFLRTSARRFPRHEALVFMGRRITYAQLHHMVERVAYALSQLGVRKGDRVAIMLPNCPQTVIAYYAALSIGAVAVLTNPLYVERELEHQWGEAGTETAVVLDLLWPRVAAVRTRLPLKRIIVTSIQDFLPFPKNVLFVLQRRRQEKRARIPYGESVIPFRALLTRSEVHSPPVSLSPDDLACLQFTGGTTGLPKGAMLTHRNLVANVYQIRAFLMQGHVEGQDRVVGILPLFHVYGMNGVMNLGIHLAATIVLLPRLDIKMLVEAIRDERPTFFLGVPSLFVAVNRYPGIERIDLTCIKGCFSGGAPLPVDVIRSFEAKTGARIMEAYGLSETSSVTHVNPRRGLRKYGSVGVPILGTDAKIMDAETGTRELPPGEVGELWVKGPQVMIGYWNHPEETAQVLVDGWLRTGDLARMDEDGYFYIVERKKDLIVTSGLNVYPREVEDVLRQHPKVHEVAVIGLPDALRGEKVVAYVVLKPGEQTTAAELREYCRARLAPYKVPRMVYFRESLPMSPAGKLLRRVLRDEILAQQQAPSPEDD